jgi:nucleoside-diphosphate-sugar epimerase
MDITKQTLVITGSSGFVGEIFALRAIREGFEVIGIDLKKSNKLPCHQLELDLTSENFHNEIPENATIIHLASLSTDGACQANPLMALDANLRATALILENAVKSKASHFVFASSEWVYPELPNITAQNEKDELKLTSLKSLYAMTKLFGESLIRVDSKVPYTILRFGIVYGPRFPPGSAAESIAWKVYSDEEVKIGSKNTARRFIHVNDLISGILKCIDIGPSFLNQKIINISGAELVSLANVANASNKILKKSTQIIETGGTPSIRNPVIDSALELLDWKPKIDLKSGLSECLAFMIDANKKGIKL